MPRADGSVPRAGSSRAGAVARLRPYAIVLLLAPLLAVGTAARAEPPPVEEFTVSDQRIVESSGLTVHEIDGERLFVTVNDSGDSGQVFTLDPVTGETVGRTTWRPDPLDVEALAPDGDHVWVGDIGDNRRVRDRITLTRVPVGRGELHAAEPTSYDLVYPDRARDAETLLRHPLTGRMYVVSKSLLGGELWAAPSSLDARAPNELTAQGPMPAIVTDGGFSADGRHLVVRSYTQAWVYTFPALQVVAHFELPSQPQGEGLAVSDEGEVFISTEGRDRPVLRVELPDEATAALDPGAAPVLWKVVMRVVETLRAEMGVRDGTEVVARRV